MSDYTEKRLKIAQELATKDGQDWEKLTDVMHKAYLHNADCAIADREGMVSPKTGEPVIPLTCPYCKDEGFIGDAPCWDCNPVGLPKEEIYPVAKKEEPASVIEKPKADSKASGYICGRCNVKHMATSKIGKRHLKHQVIPAIDATSIKTQDDAENVASEILNRKA